LYKIPASTLFIGKNLIFVQECHSTNTLAQELNQRSSAPEGSVVITDNQTAGRGQRGNSWETTQGLNFTFSILLKPSFLKPDQQFYLNIVIALGVFQYLSQRTDSQVSVKWPNDILVNQKKICGILIENTIQGSTIQSTVAGVGLNINQQFFASEKATSLKNITGNDYVLAAELDLLLSSIEKKYLQLRQGQAKDLFREYHQHLFGLGDQRSFRSDGNAFSGVITGVDPIGRLKVNTDGGERVFDLKEIEFLY
jgi:BirA family transcriptional regulator, biotin operon repressor / biotin---[acetyl-CoA-carboxylase] ligase